MNYKIQLLRAVAMFLVILNHVSNWCQFYNPSQNLKYVFLSVATTGVPIYIMISGALLLTKYDEPILTFLRKRLVRITVPFFVWSYIYLLYQKYVPLLSWQRTYEAVNVSFNPLTLLKLPTYGHLWFMYSLFFLYLTIPFLRILCKNIPKNVLYYLMILIFIGSIQQFLNQIFAQKISYLWLISFKYFADYSIYLFLGFIFIKPEFMKKLTIKWSLVCILIGSVLTIVSVFLLERKGLSIESLWGGASPFVILTTVGVFGLIMNINISVKFNKIIKSLGDASFGIYFIHMIILYLLTLVKGLFTFGKPMIVIPIVSCMCFAISYFLTLLFKQVQSVIKNKLTLNKKENITA